MEAADQEIRVVMEGAAAAIGRATKFSNRF